MDIKLGAGNIGGLKGKGGFVSADEKDVSAVLEKAPGILKAAAVGAAGLAAVSALAEAGRKMGEWEDPQGTVALGIGPVFVEYGDLKLWGNLVDRSVGTVSRW